jgi:hypothetical protein
METSEDPPTPALAGEVIAPLTRDDAEHLTALAQQQAAELWRTLLRLYEGAAHLALGYANWAEYFTDRFGKRASTAYKLLRAARVEAEISVHVDTSEMSEAQARVLAPLSPDERVVLARRVEKCGGWRSLAAREVREFRAEMRGDLKRYAVPYGEGRATAYDREEARRAIAALKGLADAVAAIRGVNRPGHWAMPEGVRRLSTEDAREVRSEVMEARRLLLARQTDIEAILENLDRVAYVLDRRGDLPPSGALGRQRTLRQAVDERKGG